MKLNPSKPNGLTVRVISDQGRDVVTPGGIYVPDTAKNYPTQGRVVAVSEIIHDWDYPWLKQAREAVWSGKEGPIVHYFFGSAVEFKTRENGQEVTYATLTGENVYHVESATVGIEYDGRPY